MVAGFELERAAPAPRPRALPKPADRFPMGDAPESIPDF